VRVEEELCVETWDRECRREIVRVDVRLCVETWDCA
jgi:hypothetical protein